MGLGGDIGMAAYDLIQGLARLPMRYTWAAPAEGDRF